MSDNFSGDFFGLIGKPMQWNSEVYGTIAVHILGISPNGRVAKVSIDGGEASTPAQRFRELSDGEGFAILGELAKRPARVRSSRKKLISSETMAELTPGARLQMKASEQRMNREVKF